MSTTSNLPPVREFALKALLWLPLGFACWVYFSAFLILPVTFLVKVLLIEGWPLLFVDVAQQGNLLQINTHVLVNQLNPQGLPAVGELVLEAKPMVYGYGLPLFAGLMMAVPLYGWQRVLQLLTVFIIIAMVQALGVVAESFKQLAFEAGATGTAVIIGQGLSQNVIALAYQFGYLILPALAPIALWGGFNRDFIRYLVYPEREPRAS